MNRALVHHAQYAGPEAPPQTVAAGQIVHYVNVLGVVRPAIVVRVMDDASVNLRVFTDLNDAGDAYASLVPYDEANGPHSWHWPPKG